MSVEVNQASVSKCTGSTAKGYDRNGIRGCLSVVVIFKCETYYRASVSGTLVRV